jgi:hypothetical protein
MKRLNLNYLVSVENLTAGIDIEYFKEGDPLVKMKFTNNEVHYIKCETVEKAIEKAADITMIKGYLILP